MMICIQDIFDILHYRGDNQNQDDIMFIVNSKVEY